MPFAYRRLFEAYGATKTPEDPDFATTGGKLGGLIFLASLTVTFAERAFDVGDGIAMVLAFAAIGYITTLTTRHLNETVKDHADRRKGEPGKVRAWQWVLAAVVGVSGTSV